MEKIIINSRKILFAKWNTVDKKWDKKDISKLDKPLAFYFPHPVELGEGVTIEDILRLLEKYETQVSDLFSGYLEECTFKDLLLELDKEPTEDLTESMDCIEFYWNINLIPLKDDFVEYKLHKFGSYRGILEEESDLEESDFDDIDDLDDIDDDLTSMIFEEHQDMSLIPLKNFKSITIVINDIVEFIEPTESADNIIMEHSILNATLEWSFFNFISTLFTELSLYGKPEDQAKLIEEFKKEEIDTNAPLILEAGEFFTYIDEN